MGSVGTKVCETVREAVCDTARDTARDTVREAPAHRSSRRAACAHACAGEPFFAAAAKGLQATLLTTAAAVALANPTGPQVRGGSATIASAGPVMTVTSTQGAVIDWQGFTVGAGETVRFVQPEGSTVINRVTGGSMEFGGSVQTSGRVLFLNGATVSGAGVSGDLGVMTAASLRNSALAPPTGVQPRDLAARAAQALRQGQAFVIGPRGTTLTTARDSNVMLVAGRGAELGDRRLPFVRVLVVAPADKPLDLDALVAARPNGIFNALFLPAIPASSTRGDAPTALAGLVDAQPARSAVVPAAPPVALQSLAVERRAVDTTVVETPAVEPVVVELRVAMLAGLPEQRVLTAELAPVEDRIGATVVRAAAPIEERLIVVWAAPVEDRVAAAVVRPEAPVEERLMLALMREPAPVEERVAAELLRPAAPVEERVMLAVLRDEVRATVPVAAKPAAELTLAVPAISGSSLSPQPDALLARQWALKEIAGSEAGRPELAALAEPARSAAGRVSADVSADVSVKAPAKAAAAVSAIVTAAVSSNVPALVQVAAQAPADRQPVKLTSIQRRMPRIFIDYRGAIFHM